ncbi:MAG TPA: tRNA preQ1(34) S-adenosylmethionine ribosyltransferase-isomerase QueA, partial [Longimicrobiales bacterium]
MRENELPTSAYDYQLPNELIAQYPAEKRDDSRLMVLDRARGMIEHRRFRDIVDYIPAGDALVVNETRVFPARLLGKRAGGGEAEVLLLRPLAGAHEWEALVRPGAKLRAGKTVSISDDISVDILDVLPNGNRVVRINAPADDYAMLEEHGHIPLPPYMERPEEALDRERYQTVYARERGSVAAPTAGLHFTAPLLEELQRNAVSVVRIVLHVGVGTFRPVEVEDPTQHVMHEETWEISGAAAQQLNAVRARGHDVWAVGTTVTRTLESAADGDGNVRSGSGATDLFIRPGYRFKVVQHLLTNFHLPRSTLLMLVSAIGGYELVRRAYEEAVAEGYRFYSYG